MNLLSFIVQIKIEKYNENKNFISWINTDSLFSFTRVLTQRLFITKNSFCLLLLLLLHFTHQKNNNPSLHNFTAYLYEHQAFIYIIPYVIWVYKPHSYLLNPSTLTFHIINLTHSHLPNNTQNENKDLVEARKVSRGRCLMECLIEMLLVRRQW
jgi:hypothetical protein